MKNLLEREIRETHARLLKQYEQYCGCEQCAEDVMTFVLNHARPRYASSTRGWTLANLEINSDQTRAELAILVFEAMRKVADSPRHDRKDRA